jgi:hypothetical protein
VLGKPLSDSPVDIVLNGLCGLVHDSLLVGSLWPYDSAVTTPHSEKSVWELDGANGPVFVVLVEEGVGIHVSLLSSSTAAVEICLSPDDDELELSSTLSLEVLLAEFFGSHSSLPVAGATQDVPEEVPASSAVEVLFEEFSEVHSDLSSSNS